MAERTIPETLKRFIQRHLHSVEGIEVLILLYKGGGRERTAAEISQALTSSRTSIERRLKDLMAAGLVDRQQDGNDWRYRFAPATSEAEARVEELVRAYPELRLRIIQLIFEGPLERIQNFADAFKIKEDMGDS